MKIEGMDQLLVDFNKYANNFDIKANQVCYQCAKTGKEQAQIYYSYAPKDGEDDGSFGLEKTLNGWSFNAYGREPVFVEFGAGVHYNGKSGTYPIARPNRISGIGRYHYHLGSLDSWKYTDANGNEVRTFGTPASMPMYRASRYVMRHINEIARKVFE